RADWRNKLRAHPPRRVPDGIATRQNTPHEENILWQKNAGMLPAAYYDEDSDGTFLARSAARFIRTHAQERFFLWLAFHEPHAPFNFPVEYAGSYDPDSVPLPQGSLEDQRAGRPAQPAASHQQDLETQLAQLRRENALMQQKMALKDVLVELKLKPGLNRAEKK
ncbi:MAG: sulfatase-like hydrolase/transferase, partial [Oceanisphaera sp.]|nr:sulfatase-like hydrolase/transferase [Oceanisphaera sp.]